MRLNDGDAQRPTEHALPAGMQRGAIHSEGDVEAVPDPKHRGPPDLEPDVERLHRQILREPSDPGEGRERAPWWLWAVAVGAIFWSGWYLGRTGGTFNAATHLAYSGRDNVVVSAANAQRATVSSDPVAAGKQVFTKNCQACHQASGLGVPGAFPPLVGSPWVVGSDQIVVRILLNGLHDPVNVNGLTYNGVMPTWRDVLTDGEIAAVATYIRQWPPNAAPPVTVATVAAVRSATLARGKPWTIAELGATVGTGKQGTP